MPATLPLRSLSWTVLWALSPGCLKTESHITLVVACSRYVAQAEDQRNPEAGYYLDDDRDSFGAVDGKLTPDLCVELCGGDPQEVLDTGDTLASRHCLDEYGVSQRGRDCDDTVAEIHPGADEICGAPYDSVGDEDCDGLVDEEGGVIFNQDADGDGFGDPNAPTQLCSPEDGFVSNSRDCDDSDADVNPDATELPYDGVDNDCTPETPDDDLDGDGHPLSRDCDDEDADVSPDGIDDTCDGVDDDCSGAPDEGTGCPCSYHEAGGHAYLFCTDARPWVEANAFCTPYGYRLASITSSDENQELVTTAQRLEAGQWWIGANDRAEEGRWEWLNGEAWVFDDWSGGEPNNDNGQEHCGLLGWRPGWNDGVCESSNPFVCESL